MQNEEWQEQPKFAAIYPFIVEMDQEQAEELHAKVALECKLVAAAIKRPDLMATDIKNADKAELCELHGYFEALAEAAAMQLDTVNQMLVPWARKFAGMVQVEALRRGVTLISVDNPPEARLAMAVALTIGFDPKDA